MNGDSRTAAIVTPPRRRAERRRQAGFTMVELTVALMAGLIVAMGIVALSREATNTFHDESRSSVAEASLRAAMDRLRADVQRAGYMSTANFLADPNVATSPGVSPDVGIANLPGITRLQSIRIMAPGTPLALSTVNGLAPDAIEISGNMTTADQFDVAYIAPATSTCQKIYLSPSSPAMYRLIGSAGDAGSATELAAAFQPASGSQFIVRLVDDSGKTQYLVTCTTGAAGIDAALNLPYVAVDTSAGGTPLKTAQSTGTMAALTGPAAGRAWVNPVAIVHWEIVAASSEPPQYQSGLATQVAGGGADPNKYDLVRTLVDALDVPVASTSEVVAEYAADLKFAFSVAGSSTTAPDPQSLTPNVVAYDFVSTSNATVAGQIKTLGGGGGVPQRIRSVRIRLATRAAQADRTATIPLLPASNDGFMYRYCVLAGGCTSNGTTLQYARARTLTTEVAVPNQSKAFY